MLELVVGLPVFLKGFVNRVIWGVVGKGFGLCVVVECVGCKSEVIVLFERDVLVFEGRWFLVGLFGEVLVWEGEWLGFIIEYGFEF